MNAATTGVLMLSVMTAACVLLVAWILMPVAVFGLKGLTRELVEQQKKTNQLLEEVVRSQSSQP